MFKLPRFQSFGNEAKEEAQDENSWEQHVRLPLQPEVYAAYQKKQSDADIVKKSAGQSPKENYAVLGNEHILSAIGDLIKAVNLDGKQVIDYILANDLVKGESANEP